MTKPNRTPLTPELVGAMAAAGGNPIAPEDLAEVTGLIDALFEMATELDHFDLTGYEPEFAWDARWEAAE